MIATSSRSLTDILGIGLPYAFWSRDRSSLRFKGRGVLVAVCFLGPLVDTSATVGVVSEDAGLEGSVDVGVAFSCNLSTVMLAINLIILISPAGKGDKLGGSPKNNQVSPNLLPTLPVTYPSAITCYVISHFTYNTCCTSLPTTLHVLATT